MTSSSEAAALVALLRAGSRPWNIYADLVEEAGSARAVLEQEQGLLADELLEAAVAECSAWDVRGIQLLTVLDGAYPENLRVVHDRPALIFLEGRLEPEDRGSVAVIGTRKPSRSGVRFAEALANQLVKSGYAVVSGLAAGIDTVAHSAALAAGGRTVAVIGTGLDRAYPLQNAALQRRIGREGAVISRFWPDAPPTRRSFPMRNAVMSGLALASVIVEAGQTSGARTQARLALAHGRPVLLSNSLLEQQWARELASRPGVHVVGSPTEVPAVVERITSTATLLP